MLEYTGCDAVMIGRAALGNPWIFREIDAYLKGEPTVIRPTVDEIKTLMIEHLYDLVKLKGEKLGVLEMRSHGPWYLKGIENATSLRKELVRATTVQEFEDAVRRF